MFAIRPVRMEDAASIMGLLNLIIEDGRFTVMTQPVTMTGQTEWLQHVMESGVCFVAVGEDSHTILGIQSIEPLSQEAALSHVGDISTFVSSGTSRQGIGKALSSQTLPAARDKGFLKVVATIRADNPGALAFYHSLGFAKVGALERHAFIGGHYVDEVLMEKLL